MDDEHPTDETVPVNNPHPVDEDPEDHIGDEIPDPWGRPGWRAEYKETEDKS